MGDVQLPPDFQLPSFTGAFACMKVSGKHVLRSKAAECSSGTLRCGSIQLTMKLDD